MTRSDNTSSLSPSALSSLTSSSPPKLTKPLAHHVNWHEAAVCALQIELRAFADILEFHPEYVLGRNDYRIDLLVIKLLSSQPIPKNIARCFKTYNLFEIKGIHSSVTVNAYYKTIGYAGLLLDQINHPARRAKDTEAGIFTSLDVSITFLSFHYPRKLIKLLQRNVDFSIEKSSQGIYYIHNETFKIQIIVAQELPPEENLYLHCLTDNLSDCSVIDRLSKDYEKHRDQEIYNKYLYQLSIASLNSKGGIPMAAPNEWIFELFGTSSEEIRANAEQEWEEYYLPQINELSSQNNYLKSLLKQHNISFE